MRNFFEISACELALFEDGRRQPCTTPFGIVEITIEKLRITQLCRFKVSLASKTSLPSGL
jgi:hypothetical protein